jgi:hypothetical protein
MIFNSAKNQFVLWFNYVAVGNCTEGARAWAQNSSANSTWKTLTRDHMNLCHATYGTTVSEAIEGPFVLHTLPVVMGASNLSPAGISHGDFALFVQKTMRTLSTTSATTSSIA